VFFRVRETAGAVAARFIRALLASQKDPAKKKKRIAAKK